MLRHIELLLVISLGAFSSSLFADQVTLKNGDRLTGTVVKSDGKTLVLHTDAADDTGGLGNDFIGGAANVIRAAGHHFLRGSDHGLSGFLAELVQHFVHGVGTGDGSARRVDAQDDGLNVAIVAGRVELLGEEAQLVLLSLQEPAGARVHQHAFDFDHGEWYGGSWPDGPDSPGGQTTIAPAGRKAEQNKPPGRQGAFKNGRGRPYVFSVVVARANGARRLRRFRVARSL